MAYLVAVTSGGGVPLFTRVTGDLPPVSLLNFILLKDLNLSGRVFFLLNYALYVL